MKKILLIFILLLEISLFSQSSEKLKNSIALDNLPSINISTWLGFPAYFNKEDSENMFSDALMATNPFIMPVYDIESKNFGPAGINIDIFIDEKLSVGFSYVNNSFSYTSKRDAINMHNGNLTTFNYDFKAKKRRFHLRSCYTYLKEKNIFLYGGAGLGFGSNFLELTTDDELYNSPLNMINEGEKYSISSRLFSGISYKIYKNIGAFSEFGFTYDKDDFLGLFRIGFQTYIN